MILYRYYRLKGDNYNECNNIENSNNDVEISIGIEENDYNNDRTILSSICSQNNQNAVNRPKYWQRLRAFLNAPIVHFFYESLSFFAFLLSFSLYLLCELDYKEEKSVAQTTTIVFIAAFVVEEIKQV